jgi:hypothetical protein
VSSGRNIEPVGGDDKSKEMVAYITDNGAGNEFIAIYVKQDMIDKRPGIVLHSGCLSYALQETFFNYQVEIIGGICLV